MNISTSRVIYKALQFCFLTATVNILLSSLTSRKINDALMTYVVDSFDIIEYSFGYAGWSFISEQSILDEKRHSCVINLTLPKTPIIFKKG